MVYSFVGALAASPARLIKQRRSSSASKQPRCTPAVVAAEQSAGSNSAGAKSPKPSKAINVIQPISQWGTGVPPAMGGHLMASGAVAPIATSKGPGIDIEPLYFTYHNEETAGGVAVFDNDSAAASGLGNLIAQVANEAIAARGAFVIALSGGSLVGTFGKALAGIAGNTDLSKWWVVYVDERNVAHSSPDSNHGAALAAALGQQAIPASQVLAIQEGLAVEQAAREYEGRLLGLKPGVLPRTQDGAWPVIDLVLLGVGPDGHVASLFPNTQQTAATSGWVLPVDNSPKPPPQRITLTLPVINSAKHVAVVALGAGKAEVVQRALEVQALPGALPVQLVRPVAGQLTWVLDAAAAADLTPSAWAVEAGKGKSGWKFPRSEAPKA